MASLLRVLLIEHVDIDTRALMRELQRGGYDVDLHQVDGPEAMDKALFSRVLDVIICSEKLPQFAVRDALATLKASGHNIPFFLQAGTTGNDTVVTIFHRVGRDYLMKDGPLALLTALARELSEVQQRRSNSPDTPL